MFCFQLGQNRQSWKIHENWTGTIIFMRENKDNKDNKTQFFPEVTHCPIRDQLIHFFNSTKSDKSVVGPTCVQWVFGDSQRSFSGVGSDDPLRRHLDTLAAKPDWDMGTGQMKGYGMLDC